MLVGILLGVQDESWVPFPCIALSGSGFQVPKEPVLGHPKTLSRGLQCHHGYRHCLNEGGRKARVETPREEEEVVLRPTAAETAKSSLGYTSAPNPKHLFFS